MKQIAARICLVIAVIFVTTGWLAHCKCPGWFGMGVLFSIFGVMSAAGKLRNALMVVLVLSGLATAFGLIGKNKERFMAQRYMPTAEMLPALPEEETTNFSSNLPIVILHTGGKYISKESPRVMHAEIHEVENGRSSPNSRENFNGLISIHQRGSTTARLPKQSFTFHTLNEKTNQAKAALLGLPREEDWVLYAPFEDKTMMRDVLAYELARKMGQYAPRSRFVELFVCDSRKVSMSDYEGVYILMEKIKRSPERVSISKLNPEDTQEPQISGGYILKRDHDDRYDSRFHTSHGGPYFFVYPDPKKITAAQRSWIKNYLNKFEAALYGEDFANPETGYAAYLDVDAFIDEHWLIEASKNVDGFRYSAFLTKDRGGKLKPGPPWDWNRAFGNANYYGGGRVEGWYTANLRPREISWYQRLREDPAFAQRCNARWMELRKSVFDPASINAMIDEMAGQLAEAQRRNYKRWPVLGQRITSNYYVGESYEEEVRWLKKWITGRIAWIDKQVGGRKRDEVQQQNGEAGEQNRNRSE